MEVIRLNRKRSLWVKFIILTAFLFLAGCGYDGNSAVDSTATGGIAFDIEWPDVNTLSDSARSTKSTAGDHCLDGTLSYVVFAVYDKDGKLLVDLDETTFDCDAGQGVVTKVPAQSGIRLVVLGLGYNEETTVDDILLRGEYGNDITVEVGKTTQLGAIQTYEFVASLARPARAATLFASTGILLEWTRNQDATLYRLEISRLNSDGSAPMEIETSDISVSLDPDVDNFFINSTFYVWSVAPVDAYGNCGRASSRIFSYYVLNTGS